MISALRYLPLVLISLAMVSLVACTGEKTAGEQTAGVAQAEHDAVQSRLDAAMQEISDLNAAPPRISNDGRGQPPPGNRPGSGKPHLRQPQRRARVRLPGQGRQQRRF